MLKLPRVPSFAASLLCSLAVSRVAAAEASPDLVGRWEGALEFGKFKFNLLFRVVPSEDRKRLTVTLEMPDQGDRRMPCSAILYHPPEVRIETDEPAAVIAGTINADRTVIDATFTSPDFPGGRPMPLVLKRNTRPEAPEPVKTYVFAAGEPPDIRGYWKGTVEFGKDMGIRMGLKVGRLPDGTFKTVMDAFDFGAADLPAASTTYQDGTAVIEWKMFQAEFEAKLDAAGKVLAGKWKQRGQEQSVSFERLEKPATALPEGVSYEPGKEGAGVVRGHWEGEMTEGGRKVALEIHLGQLPDQSWVGSVVNRNQGPGEAPATRVSLDGGELRMEWKLFRATLQAKPGPDGRTLEGEWQQGGNTLPLVLRRLHQK